MKSSFLHRFPGWKHRFRILAGLLFANQCAMLFLGANTGSYLCLSLAACLYLTEPVWDIRYLPLFLCVPNKYAQVIGLAVFLGRAVMENFTYLIKELLCPQCIAFFAFALLAGILLCRSQKGDYLGLFVQLAVYGALILLLCLFRLIRSNGLDRSFLLMLLLLEIAAGLLQWIFYGKGGDCITGTLGSAHWYGIFLVACGYCLYKTSPRASAFSGRLIKIAGAAAVFAVLLLADTKHLCLCFPLALGCDRLLSKMKVRKKVLVFAALLFLLIFSFTALLALPQVSGLLRNTPFYAYIEDERYNKKFVYFTKTLENLRSVHGFVGFGLGQYGSQICISRAKGIIYDWNTRLAGYAVAVRPFQEAIGGLMTKAYTLHDIFNSSMALSYPLVSFVPLIAETGLIGFVLLLLAMEKLIKPCRDATLLLLFFMILIFDTYLEIPCVTGTLLMAHCVINAQKAEPPAARRAEE